MKIIFYQWADVHSECDGKNHYQVKELENLKVWCERCPYIDAWETHKKLKGSIKL